MHPRRIQFEWPTEKIFELMPEKDTLRITSLMLKANEANQLISVQCTLSNGMSSPAYKSLMSDTPEDKLHEKTIEFAEDKPICTVTALGDGMTQILGLAFLGHDGEDLGSIAPEEDQKDQNLETRSVPES